MAAAEALRLMREDVFEKEILYGMNKWPDNLPDTWYYLAVQEATNSYEFTHKGKIYEI